MNTEEVLQTAANVVDNALQLKEAMTWEICGNHCAIMSAILAEASGVAADVKKYKECRKLWKKTKSFLSGLRGNADPMVVSKLMCQENPELYLEKMDSLYDRLKDYKVWSSSPYSVLALMTLTDHSESVDLSDLINRYDSLYRILHAKHPVMVSNRDRGVIAMLAVNGVNAEKANEIVESNYRACKPLAGNSDAVYSLAEILSLSRWNSDTNADHVENMMELMKLSARSLDKVEGLTFFGALTLIEDYLPEEMVLAIREVDDYLGEQKMFGGIDVDKKTRLLYAIAVVLTAYCRGGGQNPAINETMIRALLEQLLLALIEAAQAAAAAAT